MSEETRILISFWKWFSAQQGYRSLLSPWLLVHAAVGTGVAWLSPVSIAEASNSVLLPLAGVFIGLSFAWAGNSQALLESEEIETLAGHVDGGIDEYVYTFQLAVFLLLASLAFWGLAGLGIFDQECFWDCGPQWLFVAESLLFTITSLAVRECWHVVKGSQELLLARLRLRKARKKSG